MIIIIKLAMEVGAFINNQKKVSLNFVTSSIITK